MKKQLGLLVATLWAASLPAWAGGTVVVAPARYNVMQIGFDLAARNAVTLVSYQGEASTEKPLIHVWNGKEWEYVALADFQAGKFLHERPARTLIIGDEKMVPQVFAPISAWAGKQQTIASIFTPDILNQAGTALKFRAEDWQWFASRYNMKAEDINAAERKTTIYDHKIGEPFKLKREPLTQKAVESQLPAQPPSPEIVEPKPATLEPPVATPVKTDKLEVKPAPAPTPVAVTPAEKPLAP